MDTYKIKTYSIHYHHELALASNQDYLLLLFDAPCYCRINGKNILCSLSSIILLKPHQQIILYIVDSQINDCLITVTIPPSVLQTYSDETCDFCKKFAFIPTLATVIKGQNDSTMLIKNILHKIINLKDDEIKIAAKIYEKGLFTTFLALFLRECVASDRVFKAHKRGKLIIDDLFKYISNHLDDDLSLKKLEQVFFISGEHISREFKKSAGISLHRYITKSRIDLAKNYLISGKSVQEVYLLCGFGSYNHFFKAFKKECQMTPLAYYRQFDQSLQ